MSQWSEKLKPLFRWVIPALIILTQIGVMTDRIGMPWWLLNDDEGDFYSQIIHVHKKYGLSYTKGTYYMDADSYPRYEAQPRPYLHCPPLLGFVLLGTTSVFGDSREVYRGTVVAVTVFFSIFFWLSCLRLGLAPPQASLALAFLALSPMYLFYGRNVYDQGMATFFAFVAAAQLALPTRRSSAVLLTMGFLGGFSSFFAAIFAPVLLVWSFLDGLGKRLRKDVLFYVLGVGLGYGLFVALCCAALGIRGGLENLVDAFAHRTSFHSNESSDFTLVMWVTRILTWDGREFTPVLLGLGLGGFAWVLVDWRKGAKPFEKVFALFCFSGLLFLYAIKSGTWVHRYFGFYLAPSLSILSVSLLVRLFALLKLSARVERLGWAAVALLFLGLSQPTVAIRYERDGRYPTQSWFVHPPFISSVMERLYGSRRPSPPIEWVFPQGTSRGLKDHCQFWPDRAECAEFQKPLTSGG